MEDHLHVEIICVPDHYFGYRQYLHYYGEQGAIAESKRVGISGHP